MIKCNLQKILASRALSHDDLNDDTRVPKATIRKLLDNSARNIEFDELEAICDYLDCTVGELLEHSTP